MHTVWWTGGILLPFYGFVLTWADEGVQKAAGAGARLRRVCVCVCVCGVCVCVCVVCGVCALGGGRGRRPRASQALLLGAGALYPTRDRARERMRVSLFNCIRLYENRTCYFPCVRLFRLGCRAYTYTAPRYTFSRFDSRLHSN